MLYRASYVTFTHTHRAALGVLALVASFLLLYHDVIRWLVDDWDPDGDYSHGFFVVALAAYFAWQRRRELRRAPMNPQWGALAGLLGSMILLLTGTLAAETFLARISMVGTIASVIWLLYGAEHVRIVRFPLALLVLMIPIPDIIFNRIAFPLQLIASSLGEAALVGAGVPVLREGNLIVLPNMTLEVAEACSGIRSLVALFTLAAVFGHVSEPDRRIRTILLLATIPIAILVNGLRVASTGLAAHHYGLPAAEGFFHSTSGWAMFVVAGALLIGFRAVLSVVLNWPPFRRPPHATFEQGAPL